MTNTLPFAFRQAAPTDHGFILKSWLRTWQAEQRHLTADAFYQQANPLFKGILDQYGAIVACNPSNPDQLYAFIVAAYLNDAEWACFWIQTKKLYTNLGIGTALYDFVRGDRPHGPIAPFLRRKSIPYTNKYDILNAPLMIASILTSDAAGPTI